MAARFLKAAGGRLPYIVLLIFMYLADKKMLLEYGEPITFDKWVSMQHGPLLSTTYDLIKSPEKSEYWATYISTLVYDAILRDDPGDGALSELSSEVLDATFELYRDPTGRYDDNYIWDLIKQMHELPEWDKSRGVHGGVSDITYERVLTLEGLDQDTIDSILDTIAAYRMPALSLVEA
jgi:hypothetical protein